MMKSIFPRKIHQEQWTTTIPILFGIFNAFIARYFLTKDRHNEVSDEAHAVLSEAIRSGKKLLEPQRQAEEKTSLKRPIVTSDSPKM